MKQKYKRIKTNCISFLETIGTCFSLSWQASAFYTVLRLAGSLLPALFAVMGSLLGKYIFDILAGAWVVENPYVTLIAVTVGLFFVTTGTAMIQKAGQYAQTMHEEIMNGTLSVQMMKKASDADIEYFDNPEYYDKLTACMRDIMAIQFLLWNVLSATSACVSFVLIFLILSRENVVYSLLILAAAIPASIASAKYINLIYQLSLDQINGERKKGYLQSLTIDQSYVKSIKLFSAGEWLREKYHRIWKSLFLERKKINRSRTVLTMALECLPEIVTVGIGLSLSFRVLKGDATVGDYSLYSGLVSQLWSNIFLLSTAVMQILDNQLKIKNLKSLEQFENHVKDEGQKELSEVTTIEFSHVSFSYPGTEKQVLKDVSFLIHHKEKVALVGLNGSGKSTLIKLLLRFYDVQEGSILINGFDIRSYRLADLRRNFSVYFQDEPSFSFSLKENLLISDLNRQDSAAAIMEALRTGDCEEILSKASKGLETGLTRLFDEDGIELSVGQYQRVALARTFYRRHTALILDEPSSSLDPKAEHDLFEHLKKEMNQKTVLFTSHRLTNISLADRIVVLEHGRITEDGTQSELLKLDGRYAELYRYQREHFKLSRQKEDEYEDCTD